MSVHRLLRDAKAVAERYSVQRTERGFAVWRFFPWEHPSCGWRVVVLDLRTREDAERHVLRRMGLSAEPNSALPTPIPPAVVSWEPPQWLA